MQQWFDRSKPLGSKIRGPCLRPCGCERPSCCGGIMWSSRAEKHLGREGMVMQTLGIHLVRSPVEDRPKRRFCA